MRRDTIQEDRHRVRAIDANGVDVMGKEFRTEADALIYFSQVPVGFERLLQLRMSGHYRFEGMWLYFLTDAGRAALKDGGK